MKARLTACVSSFCLASCSLLSSVPPADHRSGQQFVVARATVTGDLRKPSDKSELMMDLSDTAFHNLFASGRDCGKPIQNDNAKLAATPVVAILIALSSFAIDIWNAKRKEALSERQKNSRLDSGAQVVMTANQFKSARCIVFARWAAEDAEQNPGLVVVLKIERPTPSGIDLVKARGADHFTVRPVFVRAYNSISETQQAQEGDPSITLVIAVALQQIVNVQGVPALVDIGASTTKVSNVTLTGNALCVRGKGEASCSKSTIHPQPKDDGTVVVGIGVQELGKLGFDVDMAKAELDAVAAALGPLSGKLIQGHYDREKVRESR